MVTIPAPAINQSPAAASVSSVAPASTGASPTAPFASILHDAIGQIQGLEAQATNAVTGLMTGSGVDLHTALIDTQKADVAFELALSVRNKVVAAYQQLMGTQF